jgi:hypothetical protein
MADASFIRQRGHRVVPEPANRDTCGRVRRDETGAVAEVRLIDAGDLEWKVAALQAVWGGTEVARKGELIDALELDGFVAVDGVDRIGLLTYAIRG